MAVCAPPVESGQTVIVRDETPTAEQQATLCGFRAPCTEMTYPSRNARSSRIGRHKDV